MTEQKPTGSEISNVWDSYVGDPTELRPLTLQDKVAFAHAVLAKWCAPPAAAPWRSAVLDLIDDCPGLTMEQDQWLSRRVKELDFASAPQPTRAQAGAVPLTKAELTKRAKVGPIHTERGDKVVLFLATYRNELENRFTTGWREAERYHGIKGGQHGTE